MKDPENLALARVAPAPETNLPILWRSLAQSSSALTQVQRSFSRNWVMHRTLMVRLLAATIVALVLAAAFQARGGIYLAAQNAGHLLSGRFVQVGFGIDQIAISGQSITTEADIALALAIDDNSTIFGFDPLAARQRLLELPAISEVTIRKNYPSHLIVDIVEIAPVARWRVDGVTFVIDEAGNQIGEAALSDETLPLIIGDGAADDAVIMIRALDNYPDLTVGLVALSRIADRRWDLIYETGLRVQMPELGLGQALADLNSQQQTAQVLDRDLDQIDMRVLGMMALRVTAREETSD